MTTWNPVHDVYHSFIYNRENVGATKMFLSRWMDKYTGVHPDNGILLSP